LTAALCGQLACSDLQSDAQTSSPTTGGQGETGSVRLALSMDSTVPISMATYTLTGPASFMKSGIITSTGGGALSGLIGGVPAGTGYHVSLDGVATDGTVSCSGTQTFNIIAHTTTPVTVPLVCRESINGGSASITDTTNVCPVVDGVSAVPLAAAAGGTITLSSVTHDKDNGPAPIGYQWTATAGTFSDATVAGPTFTCPNATATVTITLTVTDGGAGCTDSMTLTVSCG
jgi:hypothetical protein